ncbi:MAG: hypothetical protein AAFN09_05505 [Pseudomonadota bacterium]
MVHLNVSHPTPHPDVFNTDCQHAFVLMGKETLFGVHMTQYHCDKHRYQVILRINLPEEARAEYLRQREAHPDATFIFCNGETAEEKFSIPALGAGNVSWEGEADVMHGNIFFGFRPNEAPPPDWFPWNLRDTIPMIENVAVTVERVVLYRPFSLGDTAPDKATYLIFGRGDEAHMTNLQTGELVTGQRDIPLYGLDVDHIMSLAKVPDWLQDHMLEAGTVVTLPAIDRYDDMGELKILPEPPFKPYDDVYCLYRGLQPPRKLVAGPTYFWGSEVCNSHELIEPMAEKSLIITIMPRRFWR